MHNIAIVEDNDDDAKVLESYIAKISDKESAEYNIIRFTNALDFLSNYQPIYAVVLLDVEMPNMNGVEASQALRKLDKTCSIIFTTNKEIMDWAEMMGDPVLTTALLDRILHHANCYSFRGESYRLKHPDIFS